MGRADPPGVAIPQEESKNLWDVTLFNRYEMTPGLGSKGSRAWEVVRENGGFLPAVLLSGGSQNSPPATAGEAAAAGGISRNG